MGEQRETGTSLSDQGQQQFRMQGYAKIANLMSLSPELAILRDFAPLRVQNLLFFQAELVLLEDRLREYAAADIRAGRMNYALDWNQLRRSSGRQPIPQTIDEIDALPEEQRQWPTALLIRKTLKEYGTYG